MLTSLAFYESIWGYISDETWDGSELPGRKSQADISVKHQFPCPASPIDLGCIELINAGFMTF